MSALGLVGVILKGGGGDAGDTPAGGVILDRGAGGNVPAGFSRFFEFDVTQSTQSTLNTSLGSVATSVGAMTGKVDFDVTHGGYRTARLYWEVGDANDGRQQTMTISGPDNTYTEVYMRMSAFFSDQNSPPSGTIKLLNFDNGNATLNGSGWAVPLQYVIGNINLSGGGVGYNTTSTTLAPSTDDEYVTVEIHYTYNSSNGAYDGVGKLWINGTEITAWSSGDGTATDIDFWQGPGGGEGSYPTFTSLKWGPYRGGSGGTITQEVSIWVTGLSIWVPTAEVP